MIFAVRTEIQIDAPVAAVWAVLTDFAAYPEWNPFIVRLDGRPEVGRAVRVAAKAPGIDRPLTFRSILDTLEPERELSWSGGVPFVFGGRHWFRLTPQGPSTRLEHGEDFKGVLTRIGRARMETLPPAYEAMNRALKARAEAGPAARATA